MSAADPPAPLLPPFRWDLTRRHQLGRLVEGIAAPCYPGFTAELRKCCARVLAFAGDADLFFVGRSPESLFDYLSGALLDTPRLGRLNLLHFSLRRMGVAEILERNPQAFAGLRAYFRGLGLAPEQLAHRPWPVTFIDLVSTGETLGNLVRLLHRWGKEAGTDWEAARRRLRIVGITVRTKTSPKTWRWQQHVDWVHCLRPRAVKNVSIPGHLWTYLGNYQLKVTPSYTPLRWGQAEASAPSHQDEHLAALRLALWVFDHGRGKSEREAFVEELVAQREMRQGWFRDLVQDLRGR